MYGNNINNLLFLVTHFFLILVHKRDESAALKAANHLIMAFKEDAQEIFSMVRMSIF